MGIKNITILYFIITVFIVDFLSTVVQSSGSEENPLVKFVWETFGDIGLFWFNLVSVMVFVAVLFVTIDYLYKKNNKVGIYIINTMVGLMMTFKLSIALTNFGLIPYEVLSWYQY